MAENVNVTPGSGETIAADDIAGIKYQRVKLVTGADNTNQGDLAKGSATSANSLPVVIASDQAAVATKEADGVNVAMGATTDPESVSGNGAGIPIWKRIRTLLAGGLPAALVGGRLDVNVGAGSVTANLGTIGTAATEATQSAGNTLLGGVTETAPATDTASSGLNGRLQRIAQRLTSQIALFGAGLPAAFGSGGGVKVDIVSGAGSGGTAAGDNATFTAGTTNTTPAAGFYHASRDNLTDGRSGAVALTQKRGQLVQLETSAGVEISPALDATLIGGTQKAILRGAAKGATVAADATVIPVDANTAALSVTLAQPLDSTNDEVRTVTCIPANTLSFATPSDITTTASTPLLAAQGAGIRIYVDDLLVTNGHATVSTRVDIMDGATLLWTGYAGPAGGGYGDNFKNPLKGTANTALTAVCGTTGAQVRVSVSAHKGA